MKKYILIFLLLIIRSIYGQKDSGIILYKILPLEEVRVSEVTKNNKNKKLKSFFKKSANFELFFDKNKSLYKRKIKFNKDGEKRRINFFEIVGGGDSKFYCENGKVIESVNKYNELFLIKYDSDEWKITQKNKIIGGYVCYKAISKNKNNRVVWFAPDIPLQFGPKQFKGLPGLILEVEIGKISIVASEIVFKEISDKQIKKPTKGISITEKEYSKKIKEIAKSIGF